MEIDTYKRIQVRAQARLQNTDTSTSQADDILPKVKDFVRQRWGRIYRSFVWPGTDRSYTLQLTNSVTDYALRRDGFRILSMWDQTNGKEITEDTIQMHNRIVAPVYEVAGDVQEGAPETYRMIGHKSVEKLLTQAEKVSVVSTDNSNDVTPLVVRIRGDVSGVEVAESITLTGTSSADSSNTYDSGSELLVSAGTSDGTLKDISGVVTVSGKTSGNTYAKLGPGQRGLLYRWFSMHPTPPATGTMPTMEIWYQKRGIVLVNDNDIPNFECSDEIIEGVVADMLWEDGQDQAAQVQEVKFTNMVRELYLALSKRPNLRKQFVPANEDTDSPGGRVFFA